MFHYSGLPPAGDWAHNPGKCPDWESNLQPCGLQARTQSTETHQPGLNIAFLEKDKNSYPHRACILLRGMEEHNRDMINNKQTIQTNK